MAKKKIGAPEEKTESRPKAVRPSAARKKPAAKKQKKNSPGAGPGAGPDEAEDDYVRRTWETFVADSNLANQDRDTGSHLQTALGYGEWVHASAGGPHADANGGAVRDFGKRRGDAGLLR